MQLTDNQWKIFWWINDNYPEYVSESPSKHSLIINIIENYHKHKISELEMKESKYISQPEKAWHIAEDVFFGRKPSYENKYDIFSDINIRASSEALKDGDLDGFALMAGSSRLGDSLPPLFSSDKENKIKDFGNPKGCLPRLKRIMSKESIETWMDFIEFLKSNDT